MEKEFLEGLGLEEAAVSAILERQAQTQEQHAKELAQVRFDSALEQAVSKAGGRNTVAIRALLDVDALAAAEDREQAIRQALGQLKKECSYLFELPAPPVYAAATGTVQGYLPDEPKTLAEALKEKFKKK